MKQFSHLRGHKRVDVASLILFVWKDANWQQHDCFAALTYLSKTFPSRVGQYITFCFTWSLFWSVASPDSMFWISRRYIILGKLRQNNSHSLASNIYSLTSYPGHLDSWPFAGLWSFEFVYPLTLSSPRTIVMAWSSWLWPHPEYLCLAGPHTWHNIVLKLCAKNDGGPTTLCQKHRFVML